MGRPHCLACAREKRRRAEAEGEAAGLRWCIQKARNRLQGLAQQLEAVETMLEARLLASADSEAADRAADRVA